ncbi:SET domain-containing protein [Fusarium pseudoanthophilum]|uniref:SET domain-containing protein n=1 Tax=Fusarium pseudoanthophilum TaxID=48495 RepID=A0A8H5NYF4_9HYPO|nr:SET domain-containing protein [Fusarium pseudoanthophilum]
MQASQSCPEPLEMRSCQRQAGAQSNAAPASTSISPQLHPNSSSQHPFHPHPHKKIPSPQQPLIMSFDCGFDIFPLLGPTPENKIRYAEFLDDLTTVYKTDEEARLLILPSDADFPKFLDKRFVHFVLTNNPRIPADPNNCDLFYSLRSTSVFDATVIDTVKEIFIIAQHHFGSRVHFWTDESVIYSKREVIRSEWEVCKRKDASDSK